VVSGGSIVFVELVVLVGGIVWAAHRKPPTDRQRSLRLGRWRMQLHRLSEPPASLFRWTRPASPALAVAIVLFLTLLWLRQYFSGWNELGKGVYIDAWGALLDVLLVAVILVIFETVRQQRERIERQLEEIEDYKKWDSEQARLRIAGSIRRLAKLGKTDIDFGGLVLRNFEFKNEGIQSLRGAIFNQGRLFDNTVLEEVDFSYLDCRSVAFSRSVLGTADFGLIGKNLYFRASNLMASCFEGARLSWTSHRANEEDWFIHHGYDDDGCPLREQVYHPAFSLANLKGCSFRFADLEYADFRGALNILEANFAEAKGLASCFFDLDVRDKVMASARSDLRTPDI
jgi:uncharacterized protein YjbI with pentapeptide repeats